MVVVVISCVVTSSVVVSRVVTSSTSTTTITTTEEECHWHYYNDGHIDSEDHFVTCIEATAEDLEIEKCNRVDYSDVLDKPGGRFQLEAYSDGNCFKFHECIKFCPGKTYRCTFECNCMQNLDISRWMSGIFRVSLEKCVPSYYQQCDKNGTLNCDYKLPSPLPELN